MYNYFDPFWYGKTVSKLEPKELEKNITFAYRLL